MHRELVVQGKAKRKGMELIAVDIFFVFHGTVTWDSHLGQPLWTAARRRNGRPAQAAAQGPCPHGAVAWSARPCASARMGAGK